MNIFGTMDQYKCSATAIFLFCLYGLNAQQIDNISPKQIIGGKGDVLSITGSGFGSNRGGSYVSFFQEGDKYSDANSGDKFNYLSWSNTEIKLEMPVAFSNRVKVFVNGTEVVSKDTLRVKANLGYRQANPLLYDLLTDKNQRGGVTWYVHPVYWNNSEIKDAIAEVVQEFRCKTGANYIIEPLTQWTPLNLNQGKHIIAPDSTLSVVGFNDRMWSSCILGSETFFHAQTQLLRFNTSQNWYYGKGQPPAGASKFRYVLYHEMGHSLGLGHVNEWGESMYPSVTLLPSDNWCKRDSITASEQTAIQHYIQLSQNFSFRACGLSPMKPLDDCSDVYGKNAGTYAQEISKIRLFPNPASRQIRLDFDGINTVNIEILDVYGRVLFRDRVEKLSPLELNSDFTDGLYWVRCFHGHWNITMPLLIQH